MSDFFLFFFFSPSILDDLSFILLVGTDAQERWIFWERIRSLLQYQPGGKLWHFTPRIGRDYRLPCEFASKQYPLQWTTLRTTGYKLLS